MDDMCYLLKKATMPWLKKRMRLASEPLKITESALLLSYFLDEGMRFYEIKRGEDAGELLQSYGLISRYEGTGQNLQLYKFRIHTTEGKNREPLQWAVESEIDWFSLSLTKSELFEIVADREYALIGRVMGLIPYKAPAKVRKFTIEHPTTKVA